MTPYDPLRSFIEVIRTGTVSRAAERLGLTQPAVSGHIRVLETQLGYALFERAPRGMVPTRLAADLARQLATPLDQIDQAYAMFRMRNNSVTGHLRLVAPSPFAQARLIPAIAALENAGLTVVLELGGQELIYHRLLSGTVDLAITASAPTSPELGWAQIGAEKLLAVAAPRWVADALAGQVTVAAARQHPPLTYDADLPLIRTVLLQDDPTAELPPHGLIAADLALLHGLVRAGRGWTVLPDYLVASDLASGALTQLTTRGPAPENALNLAWLKVALRQARVAAGRAILIKAFAAEYSSARIDLPPVTP